MTISFDIQAEAGDVYRVILSSGDDAFFADGDIRAILGDAVEIVEIDLERISGTNPTTMTTLRYIAEGIGRCFMQNDKAILYYYCDELSEVFMSPRHLDLWPQEYRSHLFSLMFQRYVSTVSNNDITDITIVINQDNRPLFMHLISRTKHARYIEILKDYISQNYGK